MSWKLEQSVVESSSSMHSGSFWGCPHHKSSAISGPLILGNSHVESALVGVMSYLHGISGEDGLLCIPGAPKYPKQWPIYPLFLGLRPLLWVFWRSRYCMKGLPGDSYVLVFGLGPVFLLQTIDCNLLPKKERHRSLQVDWISCDLDPKVTRPIGSQTHSRSGKDCLESRWPTTMGYL